MTQDSNAGERNEDDFDSAAPQTPREPTAEEIQHAREMQEIADGHRYMPAEMRAARDAKPERPKKPAKTLKEAAGATNTGERIAKVLARAGLASRREIERLIGLGKIAVNGRILETPAVLVKATDVITVEGQVIGAAEPTRLWRYHKPVGLVTTERDPEGRPTVFDKLPADLPRVLKVGRLDLNSEGLLLLTNDGELARALELPSSGWVRRYRARALGHTTQARLDTLKDGTTVEGVIYGPIEATLDKLAEKADGRANVWITVSITEGKNREVRKVLESLGLKVNRLIRLAYGPFQLGNLEPGEVEEVGPRVIRELLSDLVPLKNLPPEGASQTRSKPVSRFSRDSEDRNAPAGRRGGGDRFEKPSFGDRKPGARSFGDKPKFDRPREDRGPRRDFAEKREYKPRDFDERPRFEGDGEARDRRLAREGEFERKPYAKKPYEDRSKREYGDKPAFKKPYAADDERKSYGAKPYGDRSKRDFSDRPQGERKSYAPRDRDGIPSGEAGAYERAKREFGGKPSGDRSERPAFKKPYASDGERKPWGDKPRGDRPQGDRPAFKKPYAARDGEERKSYDRPKRDFDRPRSEGDRPAFKKPYAPRDGESRSYGDKPKRDFGDRPARPQGDRPYKKPYAADGERKSYGDRPRNEGSRSRAPRGDFKGKPSGPRPSGPRPGGKPTFKRRDD